jgi:hypothetical protein
MTWLQTSCENARALNRKMQIKNGRALRDRFFDRFSAIGISYVSVEE